MLYFISDTHFNHDRDVIYKPRGFMSVNHMNSVIVSSWNTTVKPDDEVFVLGDFFLGTDKKFIEETVAKLRGNIHLIVGNHDTQAKIAMYEEMPNIVEVCWARPLEYGGRQFFLCHYPAVTADPDRNPDKATICLFGHTHSKDKFYEDNPFMYNVACDAHYNTPVSIYTILRDVEGKIAERYRISR